MTVNRDTWITQIKKDYPNVSDYVVNWMLDVYEKDPKFSKKESKKKHKVKPKTEKVEDIPPPEHFELSPGVRELCELKTVHVKFADKPTPPIKVDSSGYIVGRRQPPPCPHTTNEMSRINVDFS
jgi:hypothetical protein